MKVVVIGGTGLIGSKLVVGLAEHGHEAVAASPNTGVNTITGEGLDDVLFGADVVVDVPNSRRSRMPPYWSSSKRRRKMCSLPRRRQASGTTLHCRS